MRSNKTTGPGEGGEVPDEPAVVPRQTQKTLQFAGVGGGRPVPDCCRLGRVCGYAPLAHHVPQEQRFPGQQGTLGRVQPQPGPADGGKNLPQVRQVPAEVAGMHQQVVQVHNTTTPGDVCQYPLHHPLEHSRRVAQSERHDPKLPQPLPDGERSL